MGSDINDALGAELVRQLTPYFEQRDADTRRQTARLIVKQLTARFGQVLEEVLEEFGGPTKSAIIYEEPLNEDDSIDKLRLPKGITIRLKKEQFVTISQLRDAGDAELLDVRNVGPVTLAKIDLHLESAGFPRPRRGQGEAVIR